MPKNPDHKKYKFRKTDTSRFNNSASNSCFDCGDSTSPNARRGSCCKVVKDMGNGQPCPRGYNCWECIPSTTKCECAQFGGQVNCTNPNGRWNWSEATSCFDCPCHDGDRRSLQVITPGCDASGVDPSRECCMDIKDTTSTRYMDLKERELYRPYKPKGKTKDCKCGCSNGGAGSVECQDSSENQINAFPSHAGNVAPVQIKFLRSDSYDDREHTVFDKYSERFKTLLYTIRSGHTQHVKWDFIMKRFTGGQSEDRGFLKDVKSNKARKIRYDATDLILRIKFVPEAEIPTNPRTGDGELIYDPVKWKNAVKGQLSDVSVDTIDIPLDKALTQGLGDITIGIKPNYVNTFKVLKFELTVIDATTGNQLNHMRVQDLNKRDINQSANKYQYFVGYQDCYYDDSNCYRYETDWDSIFIVLDGNK